MEHDRTAVPRLDNPLALIHAALLKPDALDAYLAGGRRNVARAALVTAGVVVLVLGFIALALRRIVPLEAEAAFAPLMSVPAFSMMIVGILMVPGDKELSLGRSVAFSIMRSQIAITPPLALFLAVVAVGMFRNPRQLILVNLVFLLLFGAWLGGGLTIKLIRDPRRDDSPGVRWLLAGGLFAIGAVLWWLPQWHETFPTLFAPFFLGLAAGLVRPLSYLWQAALSLGLALAGRLGVPARRLLPLHPALHDELCLLPLLGLSGLLAGAAADPEAGGDWMVRVARHLGQRHAAERAIRGVVRQGTHAHPLLLRLSASDEGAALLRRITEQSPRPDPLIAAYAAFAGVTAPEAWPYVIERYREAFVCASNLPGGGAIRTLLEAGAGILRAARWSSAIGYLRAAPAPNGPATGAIEAAFEKVRSWALDLSPDADQAAALEALQAELPDLKGWPADLIAAIAEHLLFLNGVEHSRMENGDWRMEIGDRS